MRILPCALVHHTGSMIRFRPRQLNELPPGDVDLQVILPTGRIVRGHFRRNRKNPNISGPELVRYIKQIVSFGERADALVEQVSPNTWRMHRIDNAVEIAGQVPGAARRVRDAALSNADIERLLALADAHNKRTQRMQEYRRVLRPSALRRLVLSVAGATCQVDGCDAAEDFTRDFDDEEAGRAIVEVHHIEAVARCIDHHPKNLCLLCANHHRLIHGWGAWSAQHDGQNVIVRNAGHELIVVREGTVFGEAA